MCMPGRGLASFRERVAHVCSSLILVSMVEIGERMGPGGLRGLQILRSDVKSARGGFDSHAFPPFRLLLAVALSIGAGLGVWDEQPQASILRDFGPATLTAADPSTPADSASRGAPVDSVAKPGPVMLGPKDLTQIPSRVPAQDSVPARRKLSRFEQPKWVMARSAVIPGWGQLHNGSWPKALGVAAGEVGLVYRLVDDRRELDKLEQQVNEARAAGNEELEFALIDAYNSRLDGYTSRQWLLGGLVVFALLDAYIGAHFRGFNVEFEGDPALPPGDSGGDKGGSKNVVSGFRISVRSAF